MSENNRLILVFYIDVSCICDTDVPAYMNELATTLSKSDDGTDKYFIPVYKGESRVECLNPVMLNEDEYTEVKRKLDEINEYYENLLSSNRYKKRQKVIEDALSNPQEAVKLLKKAGIVDNDGNIVEIYNNVK